MGIPSLTTLLTNSSLARSEKKAKVVVDGNGFLHFILRSDIVCKFGSNYTALERALSSKITLLTNASLSLYFVFDGPLPEWKFNQRISRENQKIAKIAVAIEGLVGRNQKYNGESNVEKSHFSTEIAGLLWPMALSCAIRTISNLNIPVFLAKDEADSTIARIARKLNCSVMGNDSDFFIHNIPEGYIPLDSIEFDQELRYAVYYAEEVANYFGISTSLLPVLAALCGCDYVENSRALIQRFLKTFLKLKKSHGDIIRPIAVKLREFNSVEPPIVVEELCSLAPPTDREELHHLLNFVLFQYGSDISCDLSSEIFENLLDRKLCEISQGVFWCSSSLEDLERVPASVWNISTTIRLNLYSFLNVKDGLVTEYIRRAHYVIEQKSVVLRNVGQELFPDVDISNMDALPQDIREMLYCKLFDTDSKAPLVCNELRESDTPSTLPLVVSLRYLIAETCRKGQRLANFEVYALIAAGIRSIYFNEQATTFSVSITRRMIYIASQLDNVLSCMLLFVSALKLSHNPFWKLEDSAEGHPLTHRQENVINESWIISPRAHWSCFSGPILHYCLAMAKGGASPQSLLGETEPATSSKSLRVFETLLYIVMEGNSESIEHVIDYNNNATIPKKPKNNKIRKNSRIAKTVGNPIAKVTPPSNVFDLLSSDCSF
ncbi:hypothetical protein HK098_005611 [Nowakowskiella sp. JEL0407]|nr:hypothetical protein HK098_005611 [Nowakowskiella sp. JEL0407]